MPQVKYWVAAQTVFRITSWSSDNAEGIDHPDTDTNANHT